MQWISTTAIQLCNNLKLWYLELSFPSSEKGWHQKWFYLSDPSGSLSTYSPNRLGTVTPLSWESMPEGPTLKVAEGLLSRITALKDAGLSGWTVLRVFLFRRIVPLKVRLALMWEYISPDDQSAVVDGHLLEESVTRGRGWCLAPCRGNRQSMVGRPCSHV
jgi:hypothetical protein